MEDTMCPNVLESASAPGLMMLLVTLIAGGIVLAICYVASRRSRSRQDSSKTTHFVNKSDLASPPQLVEPPQPPEPEYLHEYAGKRGKNKKRRETQQERTHTWMIRTLKGHTGTVNDMDFSSNGRYLASCAEDERLQETRMHVQPFCQQHHVHKKNEWWNSKQFEQGHPSARLDGRQNRRTGGAFRSENLSFYLVYEMPLNLYMMPRVLINDGYVSPRLDIDLTDYELMYMIKKYVLSLQLLIDCGYPIESIDYPGCAMIKYVEYPSGPSESLAPKIEEVLESSAPKIEEYPSGPSGPSAPEVEEYPLEQSVPVCNEDDSGTYSNTSSEVSSVQEQNLSDNEKKSDDEKSLDNKDSENEKDSDNEESYDSESNSYYETSSESGSYYETSSESSYYDVSSESSSPCLFSSENTSDSENSCDSEKSSDSEKCYPNNTTRSDDEKNDRASESASNCEGSNNTDESDRQLQRTCARCNKIFNVNSCGEFVNAEHCVYHYGKRHNRVSDKGEKTWYWTCCRAESSEGCTEWKAHVWSGTVPGNDGPFEGYTPTSRHPERLFNDIYGVFSLDCEMCYTLQGMELIKVTVVNLYGEVVYDSLVKPNSEVIDYNTRFSGVKEEDMANVTKTLSDVQFDLLNFIYAETILIGHSLECDLKALRLIHKNVVDTSVLFPHRKHLPHRISLKILAKKLLRRYIQENTHNSVEDARAVMDMVLRQAGYEGQKAKSQLSEKVEFA